VHLDAMDSSQISFYLTVALDRSIHLNLDIESTNASTLWTAMEKIYMTDTSDRNEDLLTHFNVLGWEPNERYLLIFMHEVE
jgi:hypothetical protein